MGCQFLYRGRTNRERREVRSACLDRSASHLAFGTGLHVTNLNTARSVTVRVNGRGQFVPRRFVDVSYLAAETLGTIGRGIQKVKLDVDQ